MLEQQGVLEVLEKAIPTEADQLIAFKKADVKDKNIIVTNLSDIILEIIKGCKTAKEIMETLKETYQKKGILNQIELQRKLRTLRFSGSSALSEFLLDFEKTVFELKNSGGTITQEEIIIQLLSTMPESYQAVTTAIDILFRQDKSKVTLDFVKSKLLTEETRQSKNKEIEPGSSQAFTTQKKKSFSKNKNTSFPFKCYNCGMKGHKRSECTKVKPDNKKRCNMAEEEDVAFITPMEDEGIVNAAIENKVLFVVDSGATNHLVDSSTGQHLVEVKEVNYKINVAKVGQAVMARRQGNLHLKALAS